MPRARISLEDLSLLCTEAVRDQDQPLSVFEIHTLAARLTEHEFSDTHTRNALGLAVEAGLLQCRLETLEERSLRAEGRPVGRQLSQLYWLATAPADLPRTVASPVKGVRLGDGKQFAEAQRRSKQRRRAQRNGKAAAKQPAVTPQPVLPKVDIRTTVEQLVQLELEIKQLTDQRDRLMQELGG